MPTSSCSNQELDAPDFLGELSGSESGPHILANERSAERRRAVYGYIHIADRTEQSVYRIEKERLLAILAVDQVSPPSTYSFKPGRYL
jgi:hypothetical protein